MTGEADRVSRFHARRLSVTLERIIKKDLADSREATMCFMSIILNLLLIPGYSLVGGNKENERLQEAATVLEEILDMPDGLSAELLDKAECVVVLPSVKKFALGIGGKYGRGAMVCREGRDFQGPWGPPVMMALEGGNIGFQIGGQETDFLLLVMNEKGANSILKSKVKLGADASAAAGPKGRTAEASTDALMTAEILSYSRSRGLFAGVSLDGSTLRPDNGANEDIYGREVGARDIVMEGKVEIPDAGRRLVELLQRSSPKNRSN
jgi:lipid-binding SYLF domain-containing protein